MSKKTGKSIQPHWRPDFQISSTLPDIKPVRTDFIVNSITATLALLAILLVFQHEFSIRSLRSSVEDAEKRVREAEPKDEASLELSEAFESAASSIVELDTFFDGPWKAHRLLEALAKERAEGVIYTSVSMNQSVTKTDDEKFVTHRVVISGEARQLGEVTQIKQGLGESDFFNQSGFAVSIAESLQARDLTTGIYPFTLTIELEPDESANQGSAS